MIEVIDLGNKYNFAECLEICTRFLKKILDEHNICSVNKLAIKYDQANLKRFCETIIGLKTKEVAPPRCLHPMVSRAVTSRF